MTARRRFAALAVVPLLALAGCSTHAGATSSAPGGSTAAVDVGGMSFSPSVVRIAAGDTVTWSWTGGRGHDVRLPDGTASPVQSGGSWSHTFPQPGTYRYHCDIHPMMTGTVVVG